MGLCTFLQEAAPPHLMDQLPQDGDVLIIYNEIYNFAYKLFKRLTKSSENKVFIFAAFLGNILFFYFIFLGELYVTSVYVELVMS